MQKQISTKAGIAVISTAAILFTVFVSSATAITRAKIRNIVPVQVKIKHKNSQAIDKTITEQQGCLASGGSVIESSCCEKTEDFPNTCAVGACGCSPTNSHQIKTCDCGEGKCFDGNSCASTQSLRILN